MHWTDFYRVKEQLHMVEGSVLRLKRALKAGFRDKIELEAACLSFNFQILLEMKKQFGEFTFDSRIEREVTLLLDDTYSYMEKTGGKEKWQNQKKHFEQATAQQQYL